MKRVLKPRRPKLSAYTIALLSTVAITGDALAGGFAIREQSVSSQGASFAGSAAGADLSSMYWNPAATGVKSGMNTEAHNSLIIPRGNVRTDSVENNTPTPAAPFPGAPTIGQLIEADVLSNNSTSGNVGKLALVGASYANYQLSKDLWVGAGLNSGFGLASKPNDVFHQSSQLGRSTQLLTFNFNPTISYQIAPGLFLGAGVQVQYAWGRLKFATGSPTGPSTFFEGNDFSFGGTAGVLWKPNSKTSIGVGYRSQTTITLDGDLETNAGTALGQAVPATAVSAEADVELPDIVTASFITEIAPRWRALGTFEWTNWSVFENLTVTTTAPGSSVIAGGAVAAGVDVAAIPANWDDGYFFSLGLEHDYTPALTLRGGVAYEISPVQDADQRLISIPDADRVWVSLGATYKWSEKMEFDIAYTHVFIEDGDFDRESIASVGGPLATRLQGEASAEVDILSVSLKTKW